MLSARSLVVTLFLTYIAGILATRWLILGVFALDQRTVAAMVAVPLVQGALWLGWRGLFGRRSR
jgi:hypothetical protein